MERFIRGKELEKILGVSRTTLWRWRVANVIPKNRRVRGVIVWLESEILKWMAGGDL